MPSSRPAEATPGTATHALPPDATLRVQRVSLQFGDRVVLDEVELAIEPGEVVAVFGGNEAGKTTLMRIACGLATPDTGLVLVEGIDPARGAYREVQALRHRIGYVSQRPSLIANIRVYDNVALPLRYHEPLTEDEIEQRLTATLAALDLDHAAALLPAACSPGVSRRVMYARALVVRPALVLVDEPFADVDAGHQDLIAALLGEAAHNGAAVLLAASDVALADLLADRVLVLERGRLRPVTDRESLHTLQTTTRSGARSDRYLRVSAANDIERAPRPERTFAPSPSDLPDRPPGS